VFEGNSKAAIVFETHSADKSFMACSGGLLKARTSLSALSAKRKELAADERGLTRIY
jgi:hypothetical protein